MKNGVDWIFSDNGSKHKNLHCILDDDTDDDDDDDDDDGDDLNTHSPFTMNKILYDDNNICPLSDK